MPPVTVNSLIVAAVAWLAGLLLKRIPALPRDMIPQVLYYVSVVSAYVIEVLKQLVATPAHAAMAAVAPGDLPMPNPAADGTVGWILANAWDWLGRKLILGKLLKIVK
jgi:hypothetical protein